MQKRVIEAERSVRENNLWKIALISAIASVISAIAAWIAVLNKKTPDYFTLYLKSSTDVKKIYEY